MIPIRGPVRVPVAPLSALVLLLVGVGLALGVPTAASASAATANAGATTAGGIAPVAPTPARQEAPAGPGVVVVVGTRVAPPFVIRGADGTYSGLTVELWEHVARELGIAYRFEERDIPGLLGGVEDGSLFAAAAALTVTAEREERVDFSHPYLVAGLGIAVPYTPRGLGGALLALLSRDLLWMVLLLVGTLTLVGVLVWLLERKRNAAHFGGGDGGRDRQRLLVGGGDHDHSRVRRQGAGHVGRARRGIRVDVLHDHPDLVYRKDHSGVWTLAPAYDLVFSDGRGAARPHGKGSRPAMSRFTARVALVLGGLAFAHWAWCWQLLPGP